MLTTYHARIEAAALAIAKRRGLGDINKEHPMWGYFIDDAKDALSAAAQADVPDFNREMDEIMAWVRSLPDERTWLPIVTAPKGGPAILGCLVVEDMHHYVLVHWDNGTWLDEYGHDHRPDYWQPCPEPPAITEG